ncbi:propionyl-CoA synthetase [Sediminicurvatus halobius]|uniref:Propionyl-CoA synthetase n=1 Tax=Sediminicurvatus halobius TaxID=2182432 RepID=A0A2U2N8J6_9GAMM|nr:propionyl-CoA synthetase [Spiribacter halobius]PWG65521.1 propionyl-CoA synthetase [Spiribacter halobius]UEX76546.1 propionyl-CoA synthetase [Spiribacter halobius]
MTGYHEAYRQSLASPEAFWRARAEEIDWHTFPETILSRDAAGHYRWYADGELNTCHLAVDRHVARGCGEQPALIHDSPATRSQRIITYAELQDQVARFAGVLRGLGVARGDRVVIYMPMIPETVVAMLASARLGAVHSVVFGGFSPHELAVRIDDARPKVLVTAGCGIEFTRVIPYKPMVDRALAQAEHPPASVVVVPRPQAEAELTPGRDHDWHALMDAAAPVAPVPVAATDPLYILYTSGTTGRPKGVVRDNGGHAVAMNYSMGAIYDAHPGDVYWAASDVGWVVGHSYIVYGPLIRGCTSIVYEGKPVKTPDAGAFWRVIAEHRVKTFFTAPTAFRAVKKEDPEARLMAGYDLSCLEAVFVAGERLDPPTYDWLHRHMHCPVVDHWWQTETGWAIAANPLGLERFPTKAGSATVPSPGYDVRILDDLGAPLGPGESGNIAIRLPLPPGTLPTLWNDDARFHAGYLEAYDGYYASGDGGFFDEEGYLFVMGRVDDVINVAGHRLSTGAMEEVIGAHPAVAECAVVGIEDEIKGQRPLGLVVLKDGVEIEPEALERELVASVRERIGALASLREVLAVPRLPKTRSGKILRKSIRGLAEQGSVPVPSTIDDPAILDEIRAALAARQLAPDP